MMVTKKSTGQSGEMSSKLASLAEKTLRHILRFVELECCGERVMIDRMELHFKGRPGGIGAKKQQAAESSCSVAQIPYKNILSFRFNAPALYSIAKYLSYLKPHLLCYYRGKQVNWDGFRIKDAARWKSMSPQALFDNIDSLSGFCNCKCKFCYERNTPLTLERNMLSEGEAATRISAYDGASAVGIVSQVKLCLEPFTNPRTLSILKAVQRRAPYENFRLVTNGSYLTEKRVRELSALKPLTISLSLNSNRPATRRKLMKDRNPKIAVESPRLLNAHGIRYIGTIVGWPSIEHAEIEDTIRYLDEHNALSITLHLPSYTRYYPDASELAGDINEKTWDGLVKLALKLRREIRAPLKVFPAAYASRSIAPVVEGVYRNSPADLAGIRLNDHIISVDGHQCRTKSQARIFLHNSDGNPTRLEIKRGDSIIKCELNTGFTMEENLYPYKPAGYRPIPDRSGIFLSDDFLPGYWRGIEKLIASHSAGKVLIFTSKLIRPLAMKCLEILPDSGLPAAIERREIRLVIAPNRYWGGNIILGDLNVVEDYLYYLQEYVKTSGFLPDLIIIPSSFTIRRGLDLLGKSYRQIEWKLGIPVELMPCITIAD